jgi:hypothetical protein
VIISVVDPESNSSRVDPEFFGGSGHGAGCVTRGFRVRIRVHDRQGGGGGGNRGSKHQIRGDFIMWGNFAADPDPDP